MTRSQTRRRLTGVIVAAAVFAATMVATPLTASAATATVTVNFAQSTGSGNLGIGRGFLYGLSLNGSGPSDDLLLPLKPTSFRSGGEVDQAGSFGWAMGEAQFNPRYDAFRGQAQRVTRPPYNATMDMILSDLWGSDGSGIRPPNLPEPCDDGPNCTEWVAFITKLIQRLGQDGLLNSKVRFDIWNEPAANSYFWPRSQTQYYQMWNKGVQTIRALYPAAIIVGPSLPNYHWPTLQNYLTSAKAAGTMPNIWNWHFSGEPVADAAEARSHLASEGFGTMPISMNEYLFSDQQYAGFSAWYLAQLQRAGYESASHAIWSDCCGSGLLDGLLVNSGGNLLKTGAYWVYKASADATGDVVQSAGASGVDLLATRDDAAQQGAVLLGSRGTFSGTVTAQLSGIPAALQSNGTTRVVVERLSEGVLAAPIVVSNTVMTVSGGALSVQVPWTTGTDAYSIRLTPGGSSPAGVTVDGNVTGTTNGTFSYTSGWGSTTGIPDMYAGTARWASGSGQVATFPFVGTGIEVYTVRDTDQGIMTVSIDGGTATQIDNYASTRTGSALRWTSPTLASGTHTLRVTVTGQKNGASSGFTTALDKVVYSTAVMTITTIDGTVTSGTNRFSYAAGWGSTSGVSDMYQGTANWSSGAGQTATLTIVGTRVALHAVRDTDQGIVSISVDGGTAVQVDDYSSTRNASGIVWTSAVLSAGTHTVTISSTNTKNGASSGYTVAIDSADITS